MKNKNLGKMSQQDRNNALTQALEKENEGDAMAAMTFDGDITMMPIDKVAALIKKMTTNYRKRPDQLCWLITMMLRSAQYSGIQIGLEAAQNTVNTTGSLDISTINAHELQINGRRQRFSAKEDPKKASTDHHLNLESRQAEGTKLPQP